MLWCMEEKQMPSLHGEFYWWDFYYAGLCTVDKFIDSEYEASKALCPYTWYLGAFSLNSSAFSSVSGDCRYPAGMLTSVRVCRQPAGMLTSIRVCRYPAGMLTSVRVCRYPAGMLTSVRGLQVLCRYAHQCQGFAGTMQVCSSVSGVCRNWLTGSFDSAFPEHTVRKLFTCTRVSHREGQSMGEPPIFNIVLRNWLQCIWESNQEPRIQGPVFYCCNFVAINSGSRYRAIKIFRNIVSATCSWN